MISSTPWLGRRWTVVLAAIYLALHLPFLAPSLEDIDSINFALALHHFDVAQHQPHPPGYPVYIVLGRLSLWLVTATAAFTATRADALALALWSAAGGAMAIAGAARLFAALERRFGDRRVHAAWPVALMAVSPLFWLCGLRPMSDMPGLAAVLWSQALLIEGMTGRGALIAGALLAGLAAGIRIQTLALTTPLLLVAIIQQRRAGVFWLVSRPVAAIAAGVLVWAAPLLRTSGGLAGYLAALGTQAGEDFAFVDMLWSNPTARRLALSLYETFALPWDSPGLAQAIAVASVAGIAVAIIRTPRALGVMLVAFVPYIVYHLLFQETLTVRYALPAIPLVAWCATRGAMLGRMASATVGVIAAVAAVHAGAGGLAYGREPHPAYQAMQDASRRASATPPARVFAHFGLRRSLQHGGMALPFVEPRWQYEWLGPVEYWRQGGTAPVWFFADPRRTDLALIDPAVLNDVNRYTWAVAGRGELSGTRPMAVDWYRMTPPDWFLGEGWSLTPEAGGVTRAHASGPEHRPIEAWLRRRQAPMELMVGGLHLGGPGAPDTVLRLSIDGAELDAWRVKAGDPPFLRFLSLPHGVPEGPTAYATLRISGGGEDGPGGEVGIRQFDARDRSGIVWGFGDGWYEAEYEPVTGARWRWTAQRSTIELRGSAQPLTLTILGESPRKYFDGAPRVRITSQGRTLREFAPASDFEWRIDLPEDIWRNDAASVTIDLDRVYLPGAVEGTGDTRRLGLRVFAARIDTQLP